jgi:hypothetical protein
LPEPGGPDKKSVWLAVCGKVTGSLGIIVPGGR